MIGRPFLYLQWRGALTGQLWIFTDETLFIQESTIAVVAGRLEEAIVQHILQILTQSTQQTLFSHPHRGTGVKPHTLLLKKSKGTSVRVQFGSSIRYCTSIINIITVKCSPFLLFVMLLSQLVISQQLLPFILGETHKRKLANTEHQDQLMKKKKKTTNWLQKLQTWQQL